MRATWSAATAAARACARRSARAFAGTPVIQRVQSTYIRAPTLLGAHAGRARLEHATRSTRAAAASSSRSTAARPGWSTTTCMPDEADFEAVDRDWCDPHHPRRRRRLRATRSSARRTGSAAASSPTASATGASSSAGDAAHLWVPYAGYGMNAGIADALNLAWLLAAHLAGWADAGDPRRLRGRAAADHRAGLALRDGPRAADDQGARRGAGATSRRTAPRATRCAPSIGASGLRAQRPAVLLRRPQLRLLLRPLAADRLRRRGARRPTRWAASRRRPCPAAARRISGSPTAARSTTRSAPTTRCCASTARVDVGAAAGAPRAARGVPLARARRRAASRAAEYRHALVLVRADQHVAWRGDACPADTRSPDRAPARRCHREQRPHEHRRPDRDRHPHAPRGVVPQPVRQLRRGIRPRGRQVLPLEQAPDDGRDDRLLPREEDRLRQLHRRRRDADGPAPHPERGDRRGGAGRTATS